MAKTHNPSIRLCCDLFQMETRAVLMVLPGTISSELKIILEKYLFKYSQDQPMVSKCRQGQLSLRSWAGCQGGRRGGMKGLIAWQSTGKGTTHSSYYMHFLYWRLPSQNTCICPTCTIHYKLILLHALCQVLAGNHLQHAAWWRNQSRAAVLRLQTRIWVLSIWYVSWVVSFKVVKRILLQWHLKLWWNILNLVLMAHPIVDWRKNLQCRSPQFQNSPPSLNLGSGWLRAFAIKVKELRCQAGWVEPEAPSATKCVHTQDSRRLCATQSYHRLKL